MQNVIFLLSELSAAHFTPQQGFMAAIALKRMGTRKVAISCDPRITLAESHGAYARPVSDFDKIAREFARTVLAPVIGSSDILDLSHATKPNQKQPDLASLSNVGVLFTRKANGHMPLDMATRDGRELGLILYLAANTKYDSLVFPALTGINREILLGFGKSAIGHTLDGYGEMINLSHIRNALLKLKPPAPPIQTEGMKAIGQKYLL